MIFKHRKEYFFMLIEQKVNKVEELEPWTQKLIGFLIYDHQLIPFQKESVILH